MTNGIEQYIRETAEVEREELIAFGKVDVFVKDQLPSNVNLSKVLYIVRQTLPEKFFYGLEEIHVSKDEKFLERGINAYYKENKLYISPDQDNERDMIDDIIHEIAHHLEVIAAEEIYADRAILDEFLLKRKQLNFELRSEGYDTSDYDFQNAAYDEGLDFFLHKRVGYKTLEYLVPGLFVRPYAVTSIREYFASGIESYYLGKKNELFRTSPVLYKKIDELHHLAS
tara:strand:+ start:1284 stop:1964 length:681 start_codon:yes stop_codon:yes gene_type:complete